MRSSLTYTTPSNNVELNILRIKGVLKPGKEISWISSIINGDAAAHGTTTDDYCLEKVVRSINSGKAQAVFLKASLEGKELEFAGGAIESPTVYTQWDGNDFVHLPAIYVEDLRIFPNSSELFRKNTISKQNPKGIGLGTWFTHERIRLSIGGKEVEPSFGSISAAKISENIADNGRMRHIAKGLKADIGANDEPVLEIESDLPKIEKKPSVNIISEMLVKNHEANIDPNVFVMRWKSLNDEQQIAASFTDAISTFTGKPVIRVQITSNGNVPNNAILKDVISAIIESGKAEAIQRNWSGQPGECPVMRIHAVNESKIHNALKEIGARPRFLGAHPMVPVITDYTKIPSEIVDFDDAKLCPYSIQIKESKHTNNVVFFKKRPSVATPSRPAAVACIP